VVAATACAVVALSATAQVAQGHMSRNDDWYFHGSTYKEMPPVAENRKDPVNLIFYRGRGDKTNAVVGAHISDDWRYGDMSSRFCKESQRMVWRDIRGNRISDKQDFHRMTYCFGRQFHFRAWDDYEHAKIAGDHPRYQWVVGGIHHEKMRPKWCGRGGLRGWCGFTHKPDRDWDRVRVEAVKAMSRHCSYRRWRHHPGAERPYQGYTNSGYLARISLRHVDADPSVRCRGA
jgi:hypothetical protein